MIVVCMQGCKIINFLSLFGKLYGMIPSKHSKFKCLVSSCFSKNKCYFFSCTAVCNAPPFFLFIAVSEGGAPKNR